MKSKKSTVFINEPNYNPNLKRKRILKSTKMKRMMILLARRLISSKKKKMITETLVLSLKKWMEAEIGRTMTYTKRFRMLKAMKRI